MVFEELMRRRKMTEQVVEHHKNKQHKQAKARIPEFAYRWLLHSLEEDKWPPDVCG